MRQIEVQVDFQNDYRISEAFKTLRTNILFCGADHKVIMVTSCLQSDGKTTVSFGIAKAFADDGQRVLLLDTDLRKSVMARRLLGQDVTLGTTSVLCKNNSFEECLCNTQIPNLDIMFAGVVPPNPVELLGSAVFSDLLAELKERYDIIIVDTPPLGAVIDAAVVAKNCDGSVLVICANTISRHFAKNVLEQLEKSGCPVLGTVLNRVTIHNSRFYKGSYYRYGKYYKKYYRYGYGKGDYGYGYGDNPYLSQNGKHTPRKKK
ncbi:MAG: CpsD/CapB family tyrosine-protein kinase [Clostridia bacterium]|nr:CpsD/CapB family tyrosine-protein kinase [Clostridia bacterium]